MPKSKTQGALADPTKLKPFKKKNGLLKVVIETPKGSRNKYAFDPDEEIFKLKRVLPAGMTFPYDFGFVPQTEADDGDPVDVLVLMDDAVFPGCLILCRLIGVLECEKEDPQGKKVRNDRLIAVEQGEQQLYAKVNDIRDLPEALLQQIGHFFVSYHQLRGNRFHILGPKGPDVARRLLEKQPVAA